MSEETGKRPVGRPPHKVTAERRERVRTMRLDGMTDHQIASVLKIPESTLKLHYAEDLAQGGWELRGRILDVLRKKALKGDVAAIRLFESMTKGGAKLAALQAADGDGPLDKPASNAYIGKKEQAIADAAGIVSGGSEAWGDDLNPDALPN